jgi:D-lactate dehydrogenase
MKVLVYSTKPFEIILLKEANQNKHQLAFTENRLTSDSAILALNYDAISIFSADDASPTILEKLKDFGVKFITLRSAGHDNINLHSARSLKLRVANTPGYSPNAIAEHAITLLQTFNRNIIKSQSQTLDHNFLLDDLIGFNLHQKKVAVFGTGKIGSVLVKILDGFGCRVLANDTSNNKQLIDNYGLEYISKDAIAKEAEIIFICLPLTENTHHLFDTVFFETLKQNPVIINIARGAIVKTEAVLDAIDNGMVKGYATDVYEKEQGVFFYDRSKDNLKDPILQRLLCHPKTLVTPHQAFATKEALQNIATATLENLNNWEAGKHAINELP